MNQHISKPKHGTRKNSVHRAPGKHKALSQRGKVAEIGAKNIKEAATLISPIELLLYETQGPREIPKVMVIKS